jgi:hypothetical protein
MEGVVPILIWFLGISPKIIKKRNDTLKVKKLMKGIITTEKAIEKENVTRRIRARRRTKALLTSQRFLTLLC